MPEKTPCSPHIVPKLAEAFKCWVITKIKQFVTELEYDLRAKAGFETKGGENG